MKILVTGGTGVIGAGVIPELMRRRHRLRLLSRRAEHDVAEFPDGLEAFAADVSKPESLQGAADGCDAVVHITGIVQEHPSEITFERVNVLGTRHVLGEAQRAGAQRFVFISSLDADRGQSEYHRSKLRAEQFVAASSLNWVILRPGNVYGPGDDVVSLLLKLVRSLPALPVVGWGDQPFQPIWFEDLGRAVAQVVERPTAERAVLELAGREVTTTRAIIERLCDVTDRSTVAVPVPTAVVSALTRVTDKFASLDEWMERAGLTMPITSTKLQMLLEENVLAHPADNALTRQLGITPTPLDVGLMRLANELPELLPDAGFGEMERKRFAVEMHDSRYDAAGLMREVRERITEIMPIEFSAEPAAPEEVRPGQTLTGAIPGRGHIQVRTVQSSECETTFITVEGHPLAGAVTFRTEDAGAQAVRFVIELETRAANLLDWMAMQTVGRPMQAANWVAVAERVAELSGGASAGDVQVTTERLAETKARPATERMRELARQTAAAAREEHAVH